MTKIIAILLLAFSQFAFAGTQLNPRQIANGTLPAGVIATNATNATNAINVTGTGTISSTTTGGAGLTPTNATNATYATSATNAINVIGTGTISSSTTGGAALGPPGWIFDFGGTTCPYGAFTVSTTASTVSRTTYAALYAAIGTTWGAGDGSTTFNLPVILADQVTLQANGNVGTSTVGAVIAHTHSIANAATQQASGTGSAQAGNNYGGPTIAMTGSTGGAYNLAAGVRVLKCIHY